MNVGTQCRVAQWAISTLGHSLMYNGHERAMRVMEEALELAQANNVTKEEALRMIDRVFSRPVGHVQQEAAGVGVALLAYAEYGGFGLSSVVQKELRRISDPAMIIKVRESQNLKHEQGLGMRCEF